MSKNMFTLKIQKYLREKGLPNLLKEFSIKERRHGVFKNLVLLKYDQFESPMEEEIVQQARGIIVDEDDNWNVVSWSFLKFFNYGEPNQANLDWETAVAFDKLDGSLCTMYWYKGAWHVATSGSPDASGPVEGKGCTYAHLFWKIWNDLGYRKPFNTACCYIFELCTPYNKVIVRHEKPKIVFLGYRDLRLGEEMGNLGGLRATGGAYGWEIAKSHPLTTIEEIVDAAAELDPVKNEGYVVVDKGFNRLKVKSPQYVALHRMKDGLKKTAFMEIVQLGEQPEFLTYFPEYEKDITDLYKAFNGFCTAGQFYYDVYSQLQPGKDFAMKVKDTPWSSACFAVKNGKFKDIPSFYKQYNPKYLLALLESA